MLTVDISLINLILFSGSASEYTTGDSVKLECKDWFTGNWSHGPICKESGEELSITFGYDSFLYCGLEITDEKVYQAIVALAKLESAHTNDTLYASCLSERQSLSQPETFH